MTTIALITCAEALPLDKDDIVYQVELFNYGTGYSYQAGLIETVVEHFTILGTSA